jgi:hypothetical protein
MMFTVCKLGVQAPAVYCAGQTVKFSLLLWCTHEEALATLSNPDSFQVDYIRSDIFGLDVLDPHNSARRNRRLTPMGQRGRIWRTDDDHTTPLPSIDNQRQEQEPSRREMSASEKVSGTHRKTKRWQTAQMSVYRSDRIPQRMQELYAEGAAHIEAAPVFERSDAASIRDAWVDAATLSGSVREEDITTRLPVLTNEETSNDQKGYLVGDVDGQSVSATVLGEGEDQKTERAPSPTPSLENLDQDEEDPEDERKHIVRLDGELVVPLSMPPNYRWKYQGIEVGAPALIQLRGMTA